MQTATIARPVESGRHFDGKECISALTVVAILDGPTLAEPVTLRTYMAKRSDGAGRVYASLWVHGKGIHCSGAGHASGYGYHKGSAAAQAAIEAAGIELAEAIDGRGDSAIDSALIAIAVALGYAPEAVHVVRAL